MRIRTILLGALVVVASFAGATLVINALWPPPIPQQQAPLPPLAAVPPLPPLTGSSTVLAPAVIAIAAIHDALDASAPRHVSGKAKGPVSKLLSNADINYTVTRGAISVAGRPDALVVTTALSGTLQARGTIGGDANAIGDAISNLIGGNVGQQVQNLAGKTFDQHADISGTVTTTARPVIAPNWRLALNLATEINVVDVALPVGGVKLSVAAQVKPIIERSVRDQTNDLEARLRNDPFLENAARAEWRKLCRAISLGAAAPGAPDLWLEIRPIRAIAAQPRIDAKAVTLLLGVQAETRIVPNETTPSCPFPQQLDLVAQGNEGTISIAVPIDIPFTEVSRLLEAQVAGKTFPEDGSGPFAIKIKSAAIAASGQRLLISLLVNVKKRGLFSTGADATVNVWGRPVLDQEHQILRFADIALDVRSESAFGLLGAAAQAALPSLQQTLADHAVIDLKPIADDAKKRFAASVGDLASPGGGVSANVSVNALRLVGIAYDDKTLRVIANADGAVSVAISSLLPQ